MTNDKYIFEINTTDLDKKEYTGIHLPTNVSKVLANKNLGVVITSTNPTDATGDKINNGSVVLYKYPIDIRNTTNKVEHCAHIGGITDMVLSADEQ